MTTNTPVHLHLTPAAGTSTTITSNPDGTVTVITTDVGTQADDVAPTIEFPAEVEDMIQRHEANGFKGTRSRELAAELAGRGWTVKAGPKYLRYIYPGKNKVTLYANSRDIMSREYRETLDEWPHAIAEKNETRWRYNEAAYATALETIDRLEAFAAGQDIDV